jgi:elongation factor Ts
VSPVEITAADVKRLRDRTAAGMLDCRNALVSAGGDFEKAERLLKEQGLAAAAKKSGRTTASGRIFAKVAGSKAVLLELSCETDFVARNELFADLGNRLVDLVLAKGVSAKTDEMELMVKHTIGTIKENMELRRFSTLTAAPDEVLVDYVHDGRIGVVLKARLKPPSLRDHPAVKQTLFDCALHLAAFAPMFLSRKDASPAWLKEQQELAAKQVERMDKPANVKAGIAKGKVNKLLAEACVLDQPFVKDEKRTVAKVLADLGTEAGGTVEAVDYAYYRLGGEA